MTFLRWVCDMKLKENRDCTVVDLFLQFLEPACCHPSVGPATTGLVLYQHSSDVDGVRVQLVWKGGEREEEQRGGRGRGSKER